MKVLSSAAPSGTAPLVSVTVMTSVSGLSSFLSDSLCELFFVLSGPFRPLTL